MQAMPFKRSLFAHQPPLRLIVQQTGNNPPFKWDKTPDKWDETYRQQKKALVHLPATEEGATFNG